MDLDLILLYVLIVKSFVDQVDEFEIKFVQKLMFWILENFLVGIWIVNNDVGNIWDNLDLYSVYKKVLKKYFEQVQRLYSFGVRNFVILFSVCKFVLFFCYNVVGLLDVVQ